MSVTSAREIRLLNASLWRLGLDESVPCETQHYAAFVEDVLSQLRSLVLPTVFQHASGTPLVHSRLKGGRRSWGLNESQASTILLPSDSFKSRLQQFQRLSVFFLAQLGVELDLHKLLSADGNCIVQVLDLVHCLVKVMDRGIPHQGRTGISMKNCDVDQIGKTCLTERSAFNDSSYAVKMSHTQRRSLTMIKRITCLRQIVSKDALMQTEEILTASKAFFSEEMKSERVEALTLLRSLATSGSKEVIQETQGSSYSGCKGLQILVERKQANILVLEKENEALVMQIQHMQGRMEGAELESSRLYKQLILLQRPRQPQKREVELQKQLWQLYVPYARQASACDYLVAAVEMLDRRAEAKAAESRRRLSHARKLQQSERGAPFAATQTQVQESYGASSANALQLT